MQYDYLLEVLKKKKLKASVFEQVVDVVDDDFEDKGDDGDGGTAEELESCRRH